MHIVGMLLPEVISQWHQSKKASCCREQSTSDSEGERPLTVSKCVNASFAQASYKIHSLTVI